MEEKFIDEEEEYCIRVRTRASNQRGEEVMPGEAIIALPSRHKGTSPAKKRMGAAA